MIETRLMFQCESEIYRDGFALHVAAKDEHGIAIAKPAVFKKPESNTVVVDQGPLLRLSYDDAIVLMNALWVAGIRPSESIVEPTNRKHLAGEIDWLRDTVDHLLKK